MHNGRFESSRPVSAIWLLIASLSCSCSFNARQERDGAPTREVDVSSIANAVPKHEAKSRYGNPESYEVLGKRYYVMNDAKGFAEDGIASWYGKKFHGRRTSSGETYDMFAMTAAHKTLPLPTYVEVTNSKNGKKVVVKVNDRGPFHENRIIDLSYAAAKKLGIAQSGTGLVKISVIDTAQHAGREASPVVPVGEVSSEGDGIGSDNSSSVADKGFYIQVGSFSELGNAEKMREKLAAVGSHLVKISQTLVKGDTFYRVRIGPLTNIDTSDSIVARLPGLNILDHHIIVD